MKVSSIEMRDVTAALKDCPEVIVNYVNALEAALRVQEDVLLKAKKKILKLIEENDIKE